MDEKRNDQTKESPGALRQLTARLEWLGKLRDGILVSVALFYAAGYLTWAFNAWRNNLGLLPALDFQYFVAGVVPVAITAVAILAGRLLRRFLLENWSKKVGSEATGVWRLVRIFIMFVFFGSVVTMAFGLAAAALLLLGILAYVLLIRERPKGSASEEASVTPNEQPPGWEKGLRLVLLLLFGAAFIFLVSHEDAITAVVSGDRAELIETVSIIAFSVSILFLPPEGASPRKWFSWFSRIYRMLYFYGAIVFLVVLGFLYYGEKVYPNLPQELGGVRSRCAYLDVSLEEVSPETRQAILPAGKADADSRTVRSVQVEVLFSNDGLLMIRPQAREPEDSRVVYEIKRDNVQTITWCD